MRSIKKYTKDSTGIFYSHKELHDVQTLCEITKILDARQVLPATSGNFSVRTTSGQFLITRSGYHKKFTTPAHFLRLNVQTAKPVVGTSKKSSDETKLHSIIYELFPDINAVLHCHPSNLDAIKPPFFKFNGHELLKALGYKTHTESFSLPVFKNNQNMDEVALEVKEFYLKNSSSPICAFYLERHGIYCFDTSPQNAFNKLEVFLYPFAPSKNNSKKFA